MKNIMEKSEVESCHQEFHKILSCVEGQQPPF